MIGTRERARIHPAAMTPAGFVRRSRAITIAAVAALATVSLSLFLKHGVTDGFVIQGETVFPLFPQDHIRRLLSAWVEIRNGYLSIQSHMAEWPIVLFVEILRRVGLPLTLVSRIVMALVPFLAGLAGYRLGSVLVRGRPGQIVGVLAAIVALFSFQVMGNVFAGGLHNGLTIALSVLFLAQFVDFLKHPTRGRMLSVALLSSFLIIWIPYGVAILIPVVLFLTARLLKASRPVRGQIVRGLAACALVTVVLHCWWILPYGYDMIFGVALYPFVADPADLALYVARFNNALRTLLVRNVEPPGPMIGWQINQAAFAWTACLAGLAFAALLMRRFRASSAILAATVLCCVVLGLGPTPPLGFVYWTLFKHLPLFIMFRDPGKFTAHVEIYYGVLIGLTWVGVVSAAHRAGYPRAVRRGVAVALAAAVVLLCLRTSYPLVTGDMAGMVTPYRIPPEYYEARAVLDGRPDDRAVLILPFPDFYAHFAWHRRDPYATVNVLQQFISKPFVYNDFGRAGPAALNSLQRAAVSGLMGPAGPVDPGYLLELLHVGYVVLQKDQLSGLPNDEIERQRMLNAIVQRVRALPGARQIYGGRFLDVFEIDRSPAGPGMVRAGRPWIVSTSSQDVMWRAIWRDQSANGMHVFASSADPSPVLLDDVAGTMSDGSQPRVHSLTRQASRFVFPPVAPAVDRPVPTESSQVRFQLPERFEGRVRVAFRREVTESLIAATGVYFTGPDAWKDWRADQEASVTPYAIVPPRSTAFMPAVIGLHPRTGQLTLGRQLASSAAEIHVVNPSPPAADLKLAINVEALEDALVSLEYGGRLIASARLVAGQPRVLDAAIRVEPGVSSVRLSATPSAARRPGGPSIAQVRISDPIRVESAALTNAAAQVPRLETAPRELRVQFRFHNDAVPIQRALDVELSQAPMMDVGAYPPKGTELDALLGLDLAGDPAADVVMPVPAVGTGPVDVLRLAQALYQGRSKYVVRSVALVLRGDPAAGTELVNVCPIDRLSFLGKDAESQGVWGGDFRNANVRAAAVLARNREALSISAGGANRMRQLGFTSPDIEQIPVIFDAIADLAVPDISIAEAPLFGFHYRLSAPSEQLIGWRIKVVDEAGQSRWVPESGYSNVSPPSAIAPLQTVGFRVDLREFLNDNRSTVVTSVQLAVARERASQPSPGFAPRRDLIADISNVELRAIGRTIAAGARSAGPIAVAIDGGSVTPTQRLSVPGHPDHVAWDLGTMTLARGDHAVAVGTTAGWTVDSVVLDSSGQKEDPRPTLTYTRVSPTHYEAQLDTPTATWIELAQSFNRGWYAVATAADGSRVELDEHIKGNGFDNMWHVPSPGRYTISIRFFPQTLYAVGGSVSLAGYALCLAFLIVPALRSRLAHRSLRPGR